MCGTRTRSRQDDEGGNDDANSTAVIDPKFLSALITYLSGAITTAFSNVTTTRPILVNLKTHSSAIDPYNTILMNLNTKGGK